MNYLSESWTSAANMGQGHSVYTFSGNPSSVLTSLKPSLTLKEKTKKIQSYLQQMASYLIDSEIDSMKWELIESSGVGEKTTLTIKLEISLKKEGLSGFLSKKHLKKSLKGGRSFRGLK